MYILNFSHPINQQQLKQIEALLAPQKVTETINYRTYFNPMISFADQLDELWEQNAISKEDLQTLPFLINLPSHNAIAATLLAHLHGIMGYFPAVIRLRPVENSTPLIFEVAEIINLQTLRDKARNIRA